MKTKIVLISAVVSSLLFGCASFDEPTEVTQAVDEVVSLKNEIMQSKTYSVIKKPYASKTPKRAKDKAEEWLSTKKVSVNRDIDDHRGISLKQILKSFNASGVNIVTTLPVEQYFYRGFPIQPNTSADTALRILTEQLGLDYIAEYTSGSSSPYVSIIEMGTSDFRLNVPDVQVAMSIISNSSGAGSSSGEASQNQAGTQSGNTQQTSGNEGVNASGGMSGGTQGQGGSGSYMIYQSSFWAKLEKELEGMMTIMMPVKDAFNASSYPTVNVAGFADPNSNSSNAGNDSGSKSLFTEVEVGRVTVNSATGNITLTAPKHIRKRVVKYLKKLDDELNTRMIVETKIVSVTRSLEQSKGIDISGFKAFASDKYGLNVTNNVLGNISISDAAEDTFFNVGADNAITQSLIGITHADKAFQAFLAYLETKGTTQSVSNLRGSTSSGRTINLSSRVNDPILRSSTATITSDTGSTSGGSNSEIEDNWTGTTAKITPKFDPKRGVVHNLMDIEIILDAGEVPQQEPIVAGNNIQFRTINLKRVAEVKLQTETVARVGEVVLAGGIRTLHQVDGNSGVMGLKDSFVGDAFGKETRRVLVTDYFVLLTVNSFSYNEDI